MGLFICQGCGTEQTSWAGACANCGQTEIIKLAPKTDRMIEKVIKGRYKIIRKLGQGGMGAVYLAEGLKLQQRVALKFLKADLSTDSELVTRFLNEAKSYARVAHPNAVTVHDFDQDDDGNLFIAMEFCEGVDLKKVLAEQKRMPVGDAVEIVLQVADVLAQAHSKGVIHRDLKPENVMIRKGLRGIHVKVLDFGIARLMGESTKLTLAGSIAGTPRYMAPEQVEGKEIDHRIDVYSLGILLYELITGVQPFDGQTIAEILRNQVVKPMPHLADVDAALDMPEIDAVIQRATGKLAESRYPDMTQLAHSLAQALPTQATRPAVSFSPPTGDTYVRSPLATDFSLGSITGTEARGDTYVRSPLATDFSLGSITGTEARPGPPVETGTAIATPPKPRTPLGAIAGAFFGLAAIVGVIAVVSSKQDQVEAPKEVVKQEEPKPPPPAGDPTARLRAIDFMARAEAAYNTGDFPTAREYLKVVPAEEVEYRGRADQLIATIDTLEKQLASAKAMKARGECLAAIALFDEILKKNPKLKDATAGRNACAAALPPTTID